MAGELKITAYIAALVAASFASVIVNRVTGWQVGIGFGVACGMLYALLWPEVMGLRRATPSDKEGGE